MRATALGSLGLEGSRSRRRASPGCRRATMLCLPSNVTPTTFVWNCEALARLSSSLSEMYWSAFSKRASTSRTVAGSGASASRASRRSTSLTCILQLTRFCHVSTLGSKTMSTASSHSTRASTFSALNMMAWQEPLASFARKERCLPSSPRRRRSVIVAPVTASTGVSLPWPKG